MKLSIAAILVISIIALSGLATAVEVGDTETIAVSGNVGEVLTFDPAELDIDLGTIDVEDGATAVDTADLFSTVDWQVEYTEVSLSNEEHILGTPLQVTVDPQTDVPGAYSGDDALNIEYFQAFTAGDYAGSYSGDAVLTASAVIPV